VGLDVNSNIVTAVDIGQLLELTVTAFRRNNYK